MEPADSGSGSAIGQTVGFEVLMILPLTDGFYENCKRLVGTG